MIDITVDNNQVVIEGVTYHSFNEKSSLTKMIEDIIDKSKYSGESMTLWTVYYDRELKKEMKRLIKEW